jgi:hypothetical protein
MEPQRNLKQSRADVIYAHAEVVQAAPASEEGNAAAIEMALQMREEAAADRRAAAADREAAAIERRSFEENARRANGPAIRQQPGGGQRKTITEITVPPVNHCEYFVCCIFTCG